VLEQKGSDTKPTTVVFLVVFVGIAGILTAHAIAGKMIMMSNGLPMAAPFLPAAALLAAFGAVVMDFIQRRDFKASASWPTIPGQIVRCKIIEETERRRDDDDGRERISTTYRPDIRFVYRVGDADYTTNSRSSGVSSAPVPKVRREGRRSVCRRPERDGLLQSGEFRCRRTRSRKA
jgi:hypothetical protein